MNKYNTLPSRSQPSGNGGPGKAHLGCPVPPVPLVGVSGVEGGPGLVVGKERGKGYFQKCASGLVSKKRKCIFIWRLGNSEPYFPSQKRLFSAGNRLTQRSPRARDANRERLPRLSFPLKWDGSRQLLGSGPGPPTGEGRPWEVFNRC